MFTISKCILRETYIPFNVSFSHATFSRNHVKGIIVELHSSNGFSGYGEVLPRDYVSGETHESVCYHLLNNIFPKMRGLKIADYEELVAWINNYYYTNSELETNETCAKTAVEIALLDLFSKSVGKSLLSCLGGNDNSLKNIEYSAIFSSGSEATYRQYYDAFSPFQFRQFKFKVGLNIQQELQMVARLRSDFGNDIQVRIDANGGWSFEEAAEYLPQFADLGVVCCEQPLHHKERLFLPKLNKEFGEQILLCADESLCTIDDAIWLAENKAVSVFNLRVSKNGGILDTLKLADIASKYGISCQLGNQVGETSILARAGQIVAALRGGFLFHEGAFGCMLLQNDVCSHSVQFGHRGSYVVKDILSQPGLGINVSDTKLDIITKEIHQVG
ncbi:mandelate racemase/muconate lactonizing enzyme family protein [Pseudoalteromonas arctica]|uniref:O-succinylbenzoate-CoA synthase n=1 Tax=Pseudoalteromonas arctica TaxID=394751 RepID=A0A7Y0DW19_9GAMM|nr:enolase C-terminal domain-like protein [Pseudoalteromonas arctica]NMM42645.1 O-succinylbenzoate-CoA synthase [Pseudoalteromonas arctica]